MAFNGLLDPETRRVVKRCWPVTGGRLSHIVIPLVLTSLAAALEGASYALLVPLSDAVASNSFAFLDSSRYFAWIPRLLPEAFRSSPRADGYLVLVVVALALIARFAKLALTYAKAAFLNWRNETYIARVQQYTFSRVVRFGRQYFDRRSLGQVDLELSWSKSVVTLLSHVDDFAKNVLNLVAKIAVMIFISAPLSLTLLVVFPAVLMVVGRLTREVERLAHAAADVELRIKSQILDLLSTLPLVKSLSQEEPTVATYGEILDEAREVTMRRRNLMALRWPIEEVLILLGVLSLQVLLILWSGSFAPSDLARLAVFLLVVQQSLGDLKGFGTFRMAVAEVRPYIHALDRLLTDEDKHVVTAGDREFGGLQTAIALRDLDFAYADGTQVLRGVSIEIPARSFTALVGESGSGKSTVADLVSRLYECPPATIFFDGVDVREFSLPSLYSRMAIVSQDVWVLNRSLRENLVYGQETPPSDDVLLQLLEDLQMGPFLREHVAPLDLILGDRGIQLSGGQRQRVALARALIRDPDILILDEATSALDSAVERHIADVIDARFRGRTLLVIAHRLSTIRNADRILVLRSGTLVEEGTWDELLAADGEFARLHKAQFEGHPS